MSAARTERGGLRFAAEPLSRRLLRLDRRATVATMSVYKTSCHCGNVELTLDGPPRFVIGCHCSICRRSMGAPFVLVGVWAPDKCSFRAARALAERQSSPHLTRHRCPGCGAAIYNAVRTERFSSNNVAMGLFETFPEDLTISHHIYYADRVIDVDDGTPKFDGFGVPK